MKIKAKIKKFILLPYKEDPSLCLEEDREHSTTEFIGDFNDAPLFKNGK